MNNENDESVGEGINTNANTSKNKRVIINIVSNVVYQAVVLVLGLLIPKLYLESFGSEVNGLVTTISQVFSYFVLLEAGVGLATSQALYKPVANKDREKISGILSATRIHYNRTGIVYSAMTLAFALGYSLGVKSSVPKLTVFLVVMFYGVPSIISFFVQGKYRILLEVEGRGYIITTFSTVMHLVNNCLKVVLLLFVKNLILLQAMYCIEPILQVVLLKVYMKKHYGWLDVHAKPDNAAISQKNSVLVHQISGVIFNNTDAILISFFCGFKAVSVYAIYAMFFRYIDTLITSVSSGLTFRMGQLFHTDREKFKKYFDVYETFYMMGIFVLFTLAAMYLLPVIKIYTGGITDIDYIDPVLLMLFAVMKLLSNGKIPCNEVMNFAGVFKETRSHAVIEAVLNIGVSVVAIYYLGIRGGIIGTIVALLFRGNVMIYYTNRKILQRPVIKTYRHFIANGVVFACIVTVCGFNLECASHFVGVALRAALAAVWVTLVYVAVNAATDFGSFKFIFLAVKGRLKKREHT